MSCPGSQVVNALILLGIAAGVGGCDRLSSAFALKLTPNLPLLSQTPQTLPKAQRQKVQGITVFSDRPSLPISRHSVGMNLHVTQDIRRPGSIEMLRRTNARIVRWPGGSESNHYQWRTHRLGFNWVPHPNSDFRSFMERLVKPAQVDVAITLNYGSNATGTDGGDPKEAAAWVAYARERGYRIAYWTVGNEVYGTWEADFNKKPHDANTYANKVAKEFYPRIKAADPQAKVGVVVNQYDLQNPFGWTQTVLRQARYDFVEIHYYPQTPTSASDEFLLNGAIAQFQQQVRDLQRVMGRRQVPILLGEFNNVPNTPNKQTLSIVNALYHGLIFAEGAKLGLAGVFPWETVEDHCSYAPQLGRKPTGDFSSALYGWQTFATYSMFSLGLPSGAPGSFSNNCKGVPPIPYGTAFPSAHAAHLFGAFANAQNASPQARLLQAEINPRFRGVRAYAASHRQGYRLLLFNLNRDAAVNVPVTLSGRANNQTQRFRMQQTTYGRAEYDQSRFGRWVAPTQQPLARVGSTFPVTLPPWSLSVVSLDP
ncbi:MAG: hypothetical protein MH252_19315 [Thermosynechococcaceae cyanobacterium MS004]|nr:hypothetical protein [Thermosynechococcaceae cyanobacterium MS004]